ncbi:hypothetical protein [Spongiactinospora sp. 9N601]|uniref:hypothetical protein n=1 Tax=Spongiactinospora sp. 9N601 TaxID=3375149 RepID=UPI0037A9974D
MPICTAHLLRVVIAALAATAAVCAPTVPAVAAPTAQVHIDSARAVGGNAAVQVTYTCDASATTGLYVHMQQSNILGASRAVASCDGTPATTRVLIAPIFSDTMFHSGYNATVAAQLFTDTGDVLPLEVAHHYTTAPLG